MSDATFNFLNKYFTFSKKYYPFILLALVIILSLCNVSTIIVISLYFGLMVLHLILMAIIKKFLAKELQKTIIENYGDKEINENENID